MSAFLLPNAGGGQEPDRVRHGRLVQLYLGANCGFYCTDASPCGRVS